MINRLRKQCAPTVARGSTDLATHVYHWRIFLLVTIMTTSSKAEPRPKTPVKSKAKSASSKRGTLSDTNVAITTELAPAVAIALLDKTDHGPGDPAPALECIAAAAAPSETSGKVRVQLLFENGSVLPVEMSTEAGTALSKGLAAKPSKK